MSAGGLAMRVWCLCPSEAKPAGGGPGPYLWELKPDISLSGIAGGRG